MSLDRSLKSASALVRHRNVLTRAERLDQLTEEEKWNDSKSVYGLPKVGHRKMEVGKAVKEDAVEGEAAVAGAAVPGAKGAPATKGAPAAKAGAPAAKAGGAPAGKAGAPAAKGAAPAAGAKAAAPAGKKK